tara:strand:- start:53 stop:1399 length:1347 start_codon:yes stop_codon:yes gene_type:complete
MITATKADLNKYKSPYCINLEIVNEAQKIYIKMLEKEVKRLKLEAKIGFGDLLLASSNNIKLMKKNECDCNIDMRKAVVKQINTQSNTDTTLCVYKCNYIDVLLEMKRKNNYQTDIYHSGKIYNNNVRKDRTHPFYRYFAKNSNRKHKWEHNAPTWFVKKLKAYCYDIIECENCRSYDKEVEKRTYTYKIVCNVIDAWIAEPYMEYVRREGEEEESSSEEEEEWEEEVSGIVEIVEPHKYPIWYLSSLMNRFRYWGQYNGKFYNNNYQNRKTHQKELFPIPDVPEKDRTDETEKFYSVQKYKRRKFKKQIENNTLLKMLQKDFTEFKSPKISAEKYNNIYTLKVNRLWEGKKMNYKNSPLNKYSILRWKKTLPNGTCSNLGLKATYLYTLDSDYRKHYGIKRPWIFEAVKQRDAVLCVEMNGFPAWGKKTGNKKPTYEEMKLWWYKLE